MDLLQNVFQLLRDREPQVGSILQNAHTLIGQIEEDHRGANNASVSDHVDIDHLGDADQKENDRLPADSFCCLP